MNQAKLKQLIAAVIVLSGVSVIAFLGSRFWRFQDDRAEIILIVPEEFRGNVAITPVQQWNGESPLTIDATDGIAEVPEDLTSAGKARVIEVKTPSGKSLPLIESGKEGRRTIAFRGVRQLPNGEVFVVGNLADTTAPVAPAAK